MLALTQMSRRRCAKLNARCSATSRFDAHPAGLTSSGTRAGAKASSTINMEEASMSNVDKTTADGTEFRKDGSKIATESDPSGETETEKVQREQSKLPNGGMAPEYVDDERERGVAAPSPRTGA